LIQSKEETIILQTHDLSTETEINTSSDEENQLELIVQETNSELPKEVEQELISPSAIVEESEEDVEEDEIIPLNIRGAQSTEIQSPSISEEEEKISAEDEDLFEKELLSEVIASSYNLDHLISETDSDKTEVQAENIEAQESESIESIDVSDKNAANASEENKKSFSSWLRSSANSKPELFDEEKARIDREHPDSYSHSITYGSEPSKQYHYICLMYYQKDLALLQQLIPYVSHLLIYIIH
jgi:hypothetical protein